MSKRISHLKTGCLVAGFMSVFLLSAPALGQECQVDLSEAQMDFGRIVPLGSNDRLNVGNVHELGYRLISLTARCPKASKLVLRLQGATLGSQFKFAEKGLVNITLSNALLDGRSVDLAQVKSAGPAVGSYSPSVVAIPGEVVIPVSGGLPALGSVLSVQVEIRPQVPVSELSTRDTKTLEAKLSFHISSYL